MRICFCFLSWQVRNVKFVVVPNLNHQKKNELVAGNSKEEVKWIAEKEQQFLQGNHEREGKMRE